MKVTRIAYSWRLNDAKYEALQEQARLLGMLRSDVWQRYGSLAGIGARDRAIRDQWLAEGRSFPVTANAWKETLRDSIGDIRANYEAAKEIVIRNLCRRYSKTDKLKVLIAKVKRNEWTDDPLLHRLMRKQWRRGRNHTHNQIIVRSDKYLCFELGGRAWIKIPSLVPRQLISIPLTTKIPPSGTLRVILRGGRVEVHYQVDEKQEKTCGDEVVGVDKGFTEALTDSDGERYGEGLGEILSSEVERRNAKGQCRNKLRAIMKKHIQARRHGKAENIARNNLGTQKLSGKNNVFKSQVQMLIFTGVHRLNEKACTIVAEDLSSNFENSNNYGRAANRKLNSWVKGEIHYALESVSRRRGSALHVVNPAYTSQMDSRYRILLGKRRGKKFYCFDGEVLDAETNAARNVLHRAEDPEIGLYTPYKKVKAILQERTEGQRRRLFLLDSSCANRMASTESELPNDQQSIRN